MKIFDLAEFLLKYQNSNNPKTIAICSLLKQYYDKVDLDQNNIIFPELDKNISYQQNTNNWFLSKLATLEFGYNGWTFACGSGKYISPKDAIEAEKFGKLYGEKFGSFIPLATGATGGFMEIINRGYNASGNHSITSTTQFKFPYKHSNVNKNIKYCFTASTFSSMETFLTYNTIAAICFEGGIGTSFELFAILIERQRGAIPANAPIIFISEKSHLLYDLLKQMNKQHKLHSMDMQNVYLVNKAEEAIEILFSRFGSYNNIDTQHEEIRKIFEVSNDRYL